MRCQKGGAIGWSSNKAVPSAEDLRRVDGPGMGRISGWLDGSEDKVLAGGRYLVMPPRGLAYRNDFVENSRHPLAAFAGLFMADNTGYWIVRQTEDTRGSCP